MRAVIQRVSQAAVLVEGRPVGEIGDGLLIYLGVECEDSDADVHTVVDKIRHLRIFPDDKGLMNRDVAESGGSVLVVSAFTIAADARRGRRPSFDRAAAAEQADPLYEQVCAELTGLGLHVERGRFRAQMAVRSSNDGPVCILIDSKRVF